MTDLFEVLQISEDADEKEIKKAYFKLVKIHPPDKEPEKFEEIRHAYEVLKDSESNLLYKGMRKLSSDVKEKFEDAIKFKKNENFDEATKLLKKVVKLEPDNDFIKETLADIYMENYEFSKASKIYVELIDKNPDKLIYKVNLARSYKEKGWFKKALPYFEKLHEISPFDVSITLDLAECYSLSKKYDIAKEILYKLIDDYKKMKNLNEENLRELFFILLLNDSKNNYKGFNKDYDLFISLLEEDKNNLDKYRKAMFDLLNLFCELKHFEYIKKIINYIENCGLSLSEKEEEDIKLSLYFVDYTKINIDNRIHKDLIELISYHLALSNDMEKFKKLYKVNNDEIDMADLRLKIIVLDNVKNIEEQFKIIENNYLCCYELLKDFIGEVKSTKNKNYLLKRYKDKLNSKVKKYKDIFNNIGFDFNLDEGERAEDLECAATYDDFDDYVEEQPPYKREQPKIGRNDPCPCGSGKKYKKCCGK